MEKEPIKVLDVIKDVDGNLSVRITGDITGLPKAAVIKELEKAINKVKPLEIPTL